MQWRYCCIFQFILLNKILYVVFLPLDHRTPCVFIKSIIFFISLMTVWNKLSCTTWNWGDMQPILRFLIRPTDPACAIDFSIYFPHLVWESHFGSVFLSCSLVSSTWAGYPYTLSLRKVEGSIWTCEYFLWCQERVIVWQVIAQMCRLVHCQCLESHIKVFWT